MRKGDPVGGRYAVTGTLPTLADVVAFSDGSSRFDHGYYRFVSHPQLRRVEEALRERFSCRHCRLAESPQTALLELLIGLRPPEAPLRVDVLRQPGTAVPLCDDTFLPSCDRAGVAVRVRGPGEDGGGDLSRGDILIVVLAGDSATPALAAESQRAAAGGATVITYAADLPHAPVEVPGAKFHVVGLRGDPGGDGPPVRGGALLSSVDRVMDRLALQWRRRGPVLSSRAAERLDVTADVLAGKSPPAPSGADRGVAGAEGRVAAALAALEGGDAAFLYASGMSAITRVLDVLRAPGRSQVVAVGHLFNDTYKSLQLAVRPTGETPNCFLGVDEMHLLEGLVGDQTAAILTETITNPLSDVPDLSVLWRIARARGVPLVVDNTIATPENCRPLDLGADIVVHSTTKFLNGRNDHGGGAVIVRDARTVRLLAERRALWHDEMSPLEAAVLEGNLPSLGGRMRRFNGNASRVAAFLAGHSGVARVWFNGQPSHRSYAVARRILRGPGSVISFTLARDTLEGLRAFYDSPLLGIAKAPSLGSDSTLLCPYTLLTHFSDTDEMLAAVGLPRWLVRIAVGCEEDIDPILASLDKALRRSCEGRG
jgi:cystathionine beta-lyase/cystathionine gamma-synthase